jgi:polo-like kinase 1
MNEMIKRRKRLTEAEAAFFGIQLLEAVQYLHENLVIHRDLKLGNLFLDRDMNIKVGDLGLATKLENADEKRKTICGTPNYIAPEVIQGDRATRGHSFEVDIWSMGVILYTCMCGRPPYEAKDVKATYQRILANEYSFPSDVNISDYAKDIIRSMLQSKPSDRPSLKEIGMHPFFTQQAIPQSIPSTATHVAPQWELNEYGELVSVSTKNPKLESSIAYAKPGLPKSNAIRRPLGARDVNVDQPAPPSQKIPIKDGRGVVEGAIKSTLSALASIGGRSPGGPTVAAPAPQPAFRVFDETGDSKRAPSSGFKINQVTTPVHSRQVEENIVSRTAALSIRSTKDASPFEAMSIGASPRDMMVSPSYGAGPTKSSPIMQDQDTLILQHMIGRIDDVLEVTSRRSYSHMHPDSPSLTAFSRGGPQKWVSRYVDYTSKYGLGFLLNDGRYVILFRSLAIFILLRTQIIPIFCFSSGVYFNDSTKTVLEADGESFQYVERKKSLTESTRRGEPVISGHTLSVYPDHLQKKVTLLKHFRNYLIEQQKKADHEEFLDESVSHPSRSSGQPLTYLKKWVRTKHAIFFRLSDYTVQIVFYDHTEILLTSDERHITYVDKERTRKTYYLTDELVGYNGEIAKRLKYTKEILHQLVTGQKH